MTLQIAETETIKQIIDTINARMGAIDLSAHKAVALYWDRVKFERSQRDVREWPKIGCRVKSSTPRETSAGPSISIQWYKNRFVPGKAGEKGRVFSTHIKEGTTLSAEKRAERLVAMSQDYMADTVLQTEATFEAIRQEIKALTSARKILKIALNTIERKIEQAL